MLRWDMAFDPYQLIDKKARKALTRRNDRIGLMHLGGHFAAMEVPDLFATDLRNFLTTL